MISFIRNKLRKMGFDIVRFYPTDGYFTHFDIQVALDIGANEGQWAERLRAHGFQGQIYSFEPLRQAHEKLVQNARKDPNWIAHERVAIGDENKMSVINISGHSAASSLLPMRSEHQDVVPSSEYVGQDEVKVVTLDSVFEQYDFKGNILAKIDTQGFEKNVLLGAANSLKSIAILQLELSTVPLYEDSETYEYFFEYLKKEGFILWEIKPGFHDAGTGQRLQFDGVFVRKDLTE